MKKILIIDDDEDLLEWISVGLAHDGYDIRTAKTGKEGLDTALQEAPDVAIVDIRLPDIDGFEVCRRIKSSTNTEKTAIILITGVYKEIEAKEKGFAAGADDFLVKPFSYEQMQIRVARQISR